MMLKDELDNRHKNLKNELAILIDELDGYAREKKDEYMTEWYIAIRKIHDVCLLINFIEEIINANKN